MTIMDLKAIVERGGGVILDASKISSTDLKAIAECANKGHAQVTLKGAKKISSTDLKAIAEKGKGYVIFDFFENY